MDEGDEEMSKRARMDGHHKYQKTIGTHCSGYQTRTIDQCLNCKKPKCNGCPKSEWKEPSDV